LNSCFTHLPWLLWWAYLLISQTVLSFSLFNSPFVFNVCFPHYGSNPDAHHDITSHGNIKGTDPKDAKVLTENNSKENLEDNDEKF
jgi:hypothetical protein